MSIQSPEMLWFLLLVPLLLAAYVWVQRRRQKFTLRYSSLTLVREAMRKGPGVRRHVPPAMYLLSLATMLAALSRPQASVILPQTEGTVILTIDVSGSMAADDVQPTRMEAAKAAAQQFVDKQPQGVRIGVVSFTDNAAIVQSPTTDRNTVTDAINRLHPQRGTAIGRGLLTSLDAIFGTNLSANSDLPQRFQTPSPAPQPRPQGQYAPAIVVLLTDGENNLGIDPLEAARQAAGLGVRVYTIGVGSPDGTILHIQGRSVRVRVDEPTLQHIARLTNADYFLATKAEDLLSIYNNLGSQTVLTTEKTELTAVVMAGGFVFALLAGFLSILWFNRLP